LAFLDDPGISSETNTTLETALGKLILDHRLERIDRTISRYFDAQSENKLAQVGQKIERISMDIDLPTEVLNKNIGVSVFRQSDLLDYMIRRLKRGPPEELIPAHPLAEFDVALNSYRWAIKRIHTYLLMYPKGDRRHFFFAPLALRWMRGDPLPVLIDSAIRFNRGRGVARSTAVIIRETMENVEEHLRFRYVKYFTTYNSLLEVALKEKGMEGCIATIPNVPLYLEMGGSSGAMISLMALGLSRTSAESLAEYITDKDMSVEQVRNWLVAQNVERLDISPICIKEIQDLIGKIGRRSA
jgi:hypothetical protein